MRNRGTAAILAMIFLVVFSVLSISFCSMATTSMQGARNDRDGMVAMAAAESGMAFIQRSISDVILKQNQATGAAAMQAIYNQLRMQYGIATLGGQSIGVIPSNAVNITTITIPRITLHADAKLAQQCSAQLTLNPADLTVDRPNITLSVTGFNAHNNSYSRTITVTLTPRDRTMDIFKYGMFNNGPVCVDSNATRIVGDFANIGSAYTGGTAVTLDDGTIGGDVYVSGDPSALFSTNPTSGSIGGEAITSTAQALTHVHEIDQPTVPVFNPNQFAQLDSNGVTRLTQVSNSNTAFADICITGNVTFASNTVLQGLIYLMPGARVGFSGNVTIRGVIVVQDPNLDANGVPIPGSNLTNTSTLSFTGTPTFEKPEWPANSVVPPEQREALSGYSILGPTLKLSLGGNASDNNPDGGFGQTVVCGTLDEGGSAGIKIMNGTLITMSTTPVRNGYAAYFGGNGAKINRDGNYVPPYGGYVHLFSWVVDSTTYREVPQP